jgi:hypothetical protein
MEAEAVSLIMGALASGTVTGLQESASAAVKDACTRLRDLVKSRIAGHHQAEAAFEGYSQDPETWQKPLEKSLETTGVVADPVVLEAAQKLMSLLQQSGAAGARYAIQVNNAKGVQVNHDGGNVQNNTFNN